jgi:hypothetical protein
MASTAMNDVHQAVRGVHKAVREGGVPDDSRMLAIIEAFAAIERMLTHLEGEVKK